MADVRKSAQLLIALSSMAAVLSATQSPTCPCVFSSDSKTMDCSRRNLTAIPTCVLTKTDTLLLDISVNAILDLGSSNFKTLSNLRSLNVSYNLVTHVGNKTFEGLSNLFTLSVAYNGLSRNDSFESGVFKPLRRLRSLYLQGNFNSLSTCCYPDTALSQATSVQNLSIDGLTNPSFGPGFRRMKNLRVLKMDDDDGNCYILEILPNTFGNFLETPLETIEFLDCRINSIHPFAFAGLRNLMSIKSTYARGLCESAVENITAGLNSTNIERLELTGMCPGGLTKRFGADSFKHLVGTRLESMVFEGDRIEYIDPKAIRNLPRTLRYFSLRDNFINDVHFISELVIFDKLEVLDVSFQNYYSAFTEGFKTTFSYTYPNITRTSPESKKHNGAKENALISNYLLFKRAIGNNMSRTSVKLSDREPKYSQTNKPDLFHDLKSSQHKQISIHKATKFLMFLSNNLTLQAANASKNNLIHLPPNVQYIYMSNLKLDSYAVIPLTFAPNSLRYLDASACQLRGFLGPWVGLDHLEFFNISYNRFRIMNPRSFSYMKNLRTLLLQHNEIGELIMSLDRKGELFANLTRLQHIDLSDNVIKALPNLAFRNQRSLANLSLANNALTEITFILDGMVNLKLLNLSKNQLSSLPKRARRELDGIAASSDLRLDLGGNPLACDCEHVDFVNWLETTRVILVGRSNLTCRYANGSTLSIGDLSYIRNQLRVDCIVSVILKASIGSACGLALIIALAAFCYRRHWQIHYLYLTSRKILNPYHPLTGEEVEFTNDVYISFEPDFQFQDGTSMDNFVKNRMYRYLEDKGLRVMVQDSLQGEAGRSMETIITNTLRHTRKVIVLLTPSYCHANGNWNAWEFNIAVHEGIYTKRTVVVPVVVGEFCSDDYSKYPEITHYLKSMQSDVLELCDIDRSVESFLSALYHEVDRQEASSSGCFGGQTCNVM